MRMGLYLIVAHTAHVAWVKRFSFDTSLEKFSINAIMWNNSFDTTLLYKFSGIHISYLTHLTTSILSLIEFRKLESFSGCRFSVHYC